LRFDPVFSDSLTRKNTKPTASKRKMLPRCNCAMTVDDDQHSIAGTSLHSVAGTLRLISKGVRLRNNGLVDDRWISPAKCGSRCRARWRDGRAVHHACGHWRVSATADSVQTTSSSVLRRISLPLDSYARKGELILASEQLRKL
jgi:hypothetical protein